MQAENDPAGSDERHARREKRKRYLTDAVLSLARRVTLQRADRAAGLWVFLQIAMHLRYLRVCRGQTRIVLNRPRGDSAPHGANPSIGAYRMPWPMTPAINGFAASLGCPARTAPNPGRWPPTGRQTSSHFSSGRLIRFLAIDASFALNLLSSILLARSPPRDCL